jgi:shikimate kinase
MNPSHNLFIVGPTGAGKSTIGRLLAEHYGLRFIDLDQEIEHRTGVPVSTVFEIEGEAGFRARESALLTEFSSQHGIVLATGAGAVLAPENRQALCQHGYVLWLKTSVAHQIDRLQRDTTRPLLAGDRRGKLEAMVPIREPLYRQVADLEISGEVEGSLAAAEQAIQLIDKHWQRTATA